MVTLEEVLITLIIRSNNHFIRCTEGDMPRTYYKHLTEKQFYGKLFMFNSIKLTLLSTMGNSFRPFMQQIYKKLNMLKAILKMPLVARCKWWQRFCVYLLKVYPKTELIKMLSHFFSQPSSLHVPRSSSARSYPG